MKNLIEYYLAALVIVVLVAWMLVFCAAPFALLRWCGMVLFA